MRGFLRKKFEYNSIKIRNSNFVIASYLIIQLNFINLKRVANFYILSIHYEKIIVGIILKTKERCFILRENNTHRAYRDASLEEIKSFIGIIILMDLNKRFAILDYLRNDRVFLNKK